MRICWWSPTYLCSIGEIVDVMYGAVFAVMGGVVVVDVVFFNYFNGEEKYFHAVVGEDVQFD